ncbi:MAG: acetylornithine deacetylase [Actinobacteria bacterium]|nr:acetylornithine deacetylase [Actinomycetota bacterium]
MRDLDLKAQTDPAAGRRPVEEEAILGRLVARETIAGGSNTELIAEVACLLEEANAEIWVGSGTRPGTQVLHAVVGPADQPGGLLLAAHGDVVDVAGQRWSSDPFELRRADGRLYGRGTADMKGFLAVAIAAAREAGRAGTLRAPLHLAVSHDEELGCAGIEPLLEHLEGGGIAAPPAGAVVGEPTRMTVVDRHKGKAALALHLAGRAAHSSTPAAGVNAVRAAARVVVALDELQDAIAGEDQDPSFGVPHATIGIGPIAGGVTLNVVPDSCDLEVEARVIPGQSVEEIVARLLGVAEVAAGEAELSARPIAAYPPLAASADGEWARRVAELSGCAPGGAVDFGTEAGLYKERLGCEVVVFGPGDMRVAHAADESIAAAELAAGRQALDRLIAGLLRC